MEGKYYVGLNTNFHDAAIALVNDKGEIVFAQATERHTQNKRSLHAVADDFFFVETILKEYSFSDYEIATNWTHYTSLFARIFYAGLSYDASSRINLLNRFFFLVTGLKFPSIIHLQTLGHVVHYSVRNYSGHTFRFLLSLKKNIPVKKIQHFDHHLCHAMHSFYTSDFKSAIVLVIDGSGDYGKAISIYSAEGNSMKFLSRNRSSASLGAFYWIVTYLCGMDSFKGEEWKVMGMAPYGKFNDEVYQDFKKWMYLDGIQLKLKGSILVQFINKTFDGERYKNIPKADIAFTGQFFYEEILLELINALYKLHPHQNLVVSGGCALNSAANGKIHTHTPYKNVHIPSAPGDDGGAIGAALLNFKAHNPEKQIPHFQTNPYLGFKINDPDLESFKAFSAYRHETLPYAELYKKIAAELNNGKIIGWVQGRAEFGPRALGNRSILANPCLPDMKDKLNSKVKFREEFRPFAPAVLSEHAADLFEDFYPTPFMERVLNIKKEKQDLIPAVTHVDGTGRLQTVSLESNPHFYNLLNEFYKLSNVPVLLNTSLNVMGKPIVSSVSDMASVFAGSGLDVLVINNVVFYKN